MDTQTVVYTYNGLLFVFKKKEILSWDNMDQPGRHYAKRSKPDTGGNPAWIPLYEVLKAVKLMGVKGHMGICPE